MQDLLLLYSLMTENSPFITHPPSLYFSGFCDKTEPPEFPEQNESRKSPVLHRRPERPGFPIPENILFLSGSELLLFPAPTAGRKNKKLQTQSCSQPGAKITVPFSASVLFGSGTKSPLSPIPIPFPPPIRFSFFFSYTRFPLSSFKIPFRSSSSLTTSKGMIGGCFFTCCPICFSIHTMLYHRSNLYPH